MSISVEFGFEESVANLYISLLSPVLSMNARYDEHFVMIGVMSVVIVLQRLSPYDPVNPVLH